MAKEIPFGKRFSGDTTKIALKQGFAPKLKLDKGQSALYIGSGPIENVAHILSYVDADVYILSDLEFDEARTYVFSDCILKIDDRNGWVIATSDKTVSYILLDQAVRLPDLNFAKKLKIGTILDNHVCPVNRSNPDLLKIIGWTHVSGERYILTKRPDEESYTLFNAYKTICRSIKGIQGIDNKGKFNSFTELSSHWEENVNGSGWVLDAKDILKLIKKALLILSKEQRKTISEMLSERIAELSKSEIEFKKKMLTYLVEAKELLDK